MKSEFITLQLLSESFEDKLAWLVANNEDKVSKYLLEANQLIKIYTKTKAENSESLFLIPDTVLEGFINAIKEKLSDYGRQLTLKTDAFEVSFLPKGCTPEYTKSGRWAKKNRQSGKPGKIIQKVIGTGVFSNSDYEKFVYALKALWSYGGYEIKLVKGEDIRYWYNSENYYDITNTLGNSCMSHEECSGYFDLYCTQPECQMLIALKENKLAARALVWTIEDKTFMDRVYYIEDSLYNIFVNYAKENKWYIRESNCLLSDGDDQRFLSPKDNYTEPVTEHFVLNLVKIYPEWPYIDSFRYLDLEEKVLTTYRRHNTYTCSFTDGNYEDSEDWDEEYQCENCGCQYSDEDELVYSEYFDTPGCTSCMSWSEIMQDWIPDSKVVYVITDDTCHKGEVCCSEYLISCPEEYVYIEGSWYSTEFKGICKNQDGDWVVIHLDKASTSSDMFSVTSSISVASTINPRIY